jgi:hypothetical protein
MEESRGARPRPADRVDRSDRWAEGRGLDRRDFLKGSAAAVVLAGVAPWLSAASAGSGSSVFSEAYFQGLLDAWFQVDGGALPSLQLVAVHGGPATSRLDQFTVVFLGDASQSLAEGVHALAPPSGDAFALFLQPAAETAAGPTYRASFSLLQPMAPACAAPS